MTLSEDGCHVPFEVYGAHRETGEGRRLTLQGPTRRDAVAEANRRGLLVSDVRYVPRRPSASHSQPRSLLFATFALVAGLALGFMIGREYAGRTNAQSVTSGPHTAEADASQQVPGSLGRANSPEHPIARNATKSASRTGDYRHRQSQSDVEHAPVPQSIWNQMMLSGVHEITAGQIPTPSPRRTPIAREPRAGDELVVSCDTYFAAGNRLTGPARLAEVLDRLKAKDALGLVAMHPTEAHPLIAGTPVLVIAVDDGVVELRLDQHRKSGRMAPLESITLYGVPVQFAEDSP